MPLKKHRERAIPIGGEPTSTSTPVRQGERGGACFLDESAAELVDDFRYPIVRVIAEGTAS